MPTNMIMKVGSSCLTAFQKMVFVGREARPGNGLKTTHGGIVVLSITPPIAKQVAWKLVSKKLTSDVCIYYATDTRTSRVNGHRNSYAVLG